MMDAQYRTLPIKQEGKSYFPQKRNFPTSVPMDAVRKLILERLDELGTNMAAVSRAIGKSHAYLQQFIYRGVPVDLPEKVRIPLADVLRVEQEKLRVSPLVTTPNNNPSVRLPDRKLPIAARGG
jgi:hypothetical protein